MALARKSAWDPRLKDHIWVSGLRIFMILGFRGLRFLGFRGARRGSRVSGLFQLQRSGFQVMCHSWS